MKKHILTALLYTVVTAVLLGVVYPLAVTGLAHLFFAKQAEGSLIKKDGVLIGSQLIGQSFSGRRERATMRRTPADRTMRRPTQLW